MKVLAKNGPQYLTLHQDYMSKVDGEKKLLSVIEYIGQFRMKPNLETILEKTENINFRKALY